MKIYVNFEPPATVKEFLKKFFSESNYAHQGFSAVETYFDKECSTIQCEKNKFRSFDDLFDLVNTYYTVKPEELMHELLTANLKNGNYDVVLHMGNCSSIERIRMCFYKELAPGNIFTLEKYNSKWSWGELLNMIGITNKEELIAYIKKYKE